MNVFGDVRDMRTIDGRTFVAVDVLMQSTKLLLTIRKREYTTEVECEGKFSSFLVGHEEPNTMVFEVAGGIQTYGTRTDTQSEEVQTDKKPQMVQKGAVPVTVTLTCPKLKWEMSNGSGATLVATGMGHDNFWQYYLTYHLRGEHHGKYVVGIGKLREGIIAVSESESEVMEAAQKDFEQRWLESYQGLMG